MALDIGNAQATSGMTKLIYDEINAQLSPPLSDTAPDDMAVIQDSWKKLAFAISTGVVTHLLSNLEIKDVNCGGTISAAVSGGTATQNNVVFTQNNPGSGLVE